MMKRYFRGVIAAAVAVAGVATGGVAAAAGLTKVADNVYAYVDTRNSGPANSFGSNAGVVIGRDGVLVVDTLISAKEGKRLLEDIRKITEKPVKYVVNTHWHLDHSFGNSVFAKTGATIISHAAEEQSLREKGEQVLKSVGGFGLTPELMEGTTIAVPSITFTDRMAIDLGGEMVQLLIAGPSHTEGSVVVYVPGKKVLFAGDLLFTGYYPFMADGDIDSWVKNIDSVMQLDAEKIVPGHGPLSTNKDLVEMKEYLLLYDREAKRLASTDPQKAVAELKKILPKRAEGEWIIGASFNKYKK